MISNIKNSKYWQKICKNSNELIILLMIFICLITIAIDSRIDANAKSISSFMVMGIMYIVLFLKRILDAIQQVNENVNELKKRNNGRFVR